MAMTQETKKEKKRTTNEKPSVWPYKRATQSDRRKQKIQTLAKKTGYKRREMTADLVEDIVLHTKIFRKEK